MPSMYTEADADRFVRSRVVSGRDREPYRTAWRRDAARVLHSPCFRRLQGKTQLFPGLESDFFRNRLTHSLEVGQIAKSIAIRLNNTERFLKQPGYSIEPDITEIAGWCHDLGHPPFGHNGEYTLDQCMRRRGGFEGNAQTLRILFRLEKKYKDSTTPYGIDEHGKDTRHGLNLTYRTLAACLKYDRCIPTLRPENTSLAKGYYAEDETLVQQIKDRVTGITGFNEPFKVIECYVMDVADDIAYSTYDLEDALKARFLSPFDLMSARPNLIEAVAENIRQRSNLAPDGKVVREVIYDLFRKLFVAQPARDTRAQGPDQGERFRYAAAAGAYEAALEIRDDGYLRTHFTSELVGEFIRSVNLIPDPKMPALSKVELAREARLKVEILKNFTYQSLILAPDFQFIRHRTQEVVKRLFDCLESDHGAELLPADIRGIYESIESGFRPRVVADFIAGMTDQYAIEYYGRLFSRTHQTIFRRI
jgi:dGTPase